MKWLATVGVLVVLVGAMVFRDATAAYRAVPNPQKLTIRVLPAGKGEEVLPANIAVEPGVPVELTFVNSTRDFHTFTVPGLRFSALILPGRASAPRVVHVTFTPRAYGVFRWYCVFCKGVHHDGSMGGKVYAIIQA